MPPEPDELQSPSLGVPSVIDQEADRAKKFDFLVIGIEDHHVIVLFGNDEVSILDRMNTKFDLTLAIEGAADFGTVTSGADAKRSIIPWTLRASNPVGSICTNR
jgi:hypothetical protein